MTCQSSRAGHCWLGCTLLFSLWMCIEFAGPIRSATAGAHGISIANNGLIRSGKWMPFCSGQISCIRSWCSRLWEGYRLLSSRMGSLHFGFSPGTLSFKVWAYFKISRNHRIWDSFRATFWGASPTIILLACARLLALWTLGTYISLAPSGNPEALSTYLKYSPSVRETPSCI